MYSMEIVILQTNCLRNESLLCGKIHYFIIIMLLKWPFWEEKTYTAGQCVSHNKKAGGRQPCTGTASQARAVRATVFPPAFSATLDKENCHLMDTDGGASLGPASGTYWARKQNGHKTKGYKPAQSTDLTKLSQKSTGPLLSHLTVQLIHMISATTTDHKCDQNEGGVTEGVTPIRTEGNFRDDQVSPKGSDKWLRNETL